MPTLEHNGIVEMFRENPELAPHFMATLFHVEVLPHTSAVVVESSLDQLLPVEYRADLVLELRDAAGALVLAIVVEVQREEDRDKKYSWPVYVAVVRARKRCDTAVLVVATDAVVAAWAAEDIDLGLGLGHVKPLVLGPTVMPEITDPAEAEREVELAVLAAVTHGNGPSGMAVVLAAVHALARLDLDHAAVYFQIIYDALREPMRRALEALVMERQTQGKATFPPFAQKIFERGISEGFRDGERKGFHDGERKGFHDGELKGKHDVLFRLLARAGIALSDEQRNRILACEDGATLDRWAENVLGAKTAADVLS
ncbi:hypothetical protein [Sorangium sp. So ce1335]|uniref:hypothetical protein n=1 Tax=Sorangium sp. So ce1335 TaxID=3133335 RepID=UPI003F5F1E94